MCILVALDQVLQHSSADSAPARAGTKVRVLERLQELPTLWYQIRCFAIVAQTSKILQNHIGNCTKAYVLIQQMLGSVTSHTVA